MNTDKLVVLLSNHEETSKQLAGLKMAYDTLEDRRVHVQLIGEGSIEAFEMPASDIAKSLAEKIQQLQVEVDSNAERIAKITSILNTNAIEELE